MGESLLLVKDGKVIANLGRSYHFTDNNTIERDIEKLVERSEETRDRIVKEMYGFAIWHPTKPEHIMSVLCDIEDSLEYMRDEMIEYGKKIMLADMLEQGFEAKRDVELGKLKDYSRLLPDH